MAETDKKVSQLPAASQVNDTDLVMVSQGSQGSGWASLRTNILAIANKIVSGINFATALQTTDKTITGAINEAAASGGTGAIADTFDTTQTYDVGDYVIYEGSLYKCTTAVSVAGQWDENDWTETLVMDEVEQGGGGTTVIANPTGTPTDDLNSIQIGSDIYEIPTGGGSGGGIIADKDLLWEYSDSYDITLAHPFTDYDFLVFEGNNYTDSNHKGGAIISSVELNNIKGVSGKLYAFAGVTADGFANYAVVSDTSITYDSGGNNVRVLRVWGIKFTSGGGSASWKDITGILTAGQTEITLSDVSITVNSTFEPFTDKFGVNPTNMEFIDGAETVLQPLVTQESELLGTVTVASTFSDYYGWKAFTSAGSWVGTGSIDQWLAYEFPTDVTVSAIQWNCDDASRRGIVTSIQYSNDGTTWNDCTLSKNERGDVEISSVNSAKHWRLFFAAPFNTWTEPIISNLEFIAVVNGIKLTFPVQSENLNVKVRVS